jgi:hypothetical protein
MFTAQDAQQQQVQQQQHVPMHKRHICPEKVGELASLPTPAVADHVGAAVEGNRATAIGGEQEPASNSSSRSSSSNNRLVTVTCIWFSRWWLLCQASLAALCSTARAAESANTHQQPRK